MCPYCHTKKPKPLTCPTCGFKSFDDYCPICGDKLLTDFQMEKMKKFKEKSRKKRIQKKREEEEIREYDNIKHEELPMPKLLLELSRKPNFKNKGLIERKIRKKEIKTLYELDETIKNLDKLKK